VVWLYRQSINLPKIAATLMPRALPAQFLWPFLNFENSFKGMNDLTLCLKAANIVTQIINPFITTWNVAWREGFRE